MKKKPPTPRRGLIAEQLVTWSQNLTPSQASWAVATDAVSCFLPPIGECSDYPYFCPSGFLSTAGVRGKRIFWSLAARPLGAITGRA